MEECGRARPDGNPLRLERVQEPGGDVLVVERQGLDPRQDRPHGRLVGVVTHQGVGDDLGCAVVRIRGEQPEAHAERGGSLCHHPGQLTTADDGNGRKATRGRRHGPEA
jgi:hypothetical protein